MRRKNMMEARGFTLAELLVALVILGVIATFAIPKVLQTQADEKRKAVFRETLAALSDIAQQKARTGQGFANVTELKSYFRDNLNYIKRCPTNPGTEGCWDSIHWAGSAGNAEAYVLANGAAISSVNGGGGLDRETLAIDWNGLASPNVEGDDILTLTACFGPGACNGGASPITGNRPKGAGVIGPYDPAAAVPLYEEIFAD